MKSDYIIYGALFLVVIILGYSMRDFIEGNGSSNGAPAQAAPVQASQNQGLTRTTGSTSDGDVEIAITPKGIINGKLTFDFAANTHSVSLDQFDLSKITYILYKDKNYAPVSVPELSGHHSSGELVFELSEMPKSFNIIIKGIPSEQEREFDWRQ